MFRNKDYILTILREGSFSKAAQKLYVSQPSLSATVKRIEEKLSSPIFNRTNPITLTDVGKMYIKYALEIEEKERNFEKYVFDNINILAGKIKIGGSSLLSSFVLPNMIANFKNDYPYIEFEIYEDNTRNLLHKLEQGELDIIIDDIEIDEDYLQPTIAKSEILLLAVPKSFEINNTLKEFRLTEKSIKSNKHLSDRYLISIENFSNEPFILLNPENGTGRRAIKIFENHNLTPNIVFHLDQQVTAYNTASSGMGVTFVSDTLVKHINFTSPLYYYVLDDKEVLRDICFYNTGKRYLSTACRKFIEYTSLKHIEKNSSRSFHAKNFL